jgi:hypothetical protein
MGSWVHGFMGSWVQGFMGSWVQQDNTALRDEPLASLRCCPAPDSRLPSPYCRTGLSPQPPRRGGVCRTTHQSPPFSSSSCLPAEAGEPPRRRQGCRRSESENRQPATGNRQPATKRTGEAWWPRPIGCSAFRGVSARRYRRNVFRIVRELVDDRAVCPYRPSRLNDDLQRTQ